MKALSFASCAAAAFALLAAAPVLCPRVQFCAAAETETETALPDWIPGDFESGAELLKQNGELTIEGDLLCFAEKEYSGDLRYDFHYCSEYFEPVLSERFDAGTGVFMRVELLRAITPGITEIHHTDSLSDANSSMFALEIDEDLNITASKMPEWCPKTFDSALSFYNSYGKTRIRNGLLCTVFHESYPQEMRDRIGDRYTLRYTEEQLKCLCSVRFQSGNDCLLVSMFTGTAPGDAAVTHCDTAVNEVPYDYTFRIDDTLNIKETDLYAWVPDCSREFLSALPDDYETNSFILTHGGDVAFLLESTGGTGYAWAEAEHDPALMEYVRRIDCTPLRIYTDSMAPSGGKIQEVRVYRAKKDGQTELRLDLMPPGTGAEAADSAGGVMQITDDADMVLLPGEARVTLINAGTGRPVIMQNKSFYIDYLIGEENLDPSDGLQYNFARWLEIKSAVSKQPLGSVFANDEYQIWLTGGTLPQGYSCDAVYSNGACDAGDVITVTRYTDDIADITVKLQFAAEGDMNNDGAFSIADAVMLQRWLLGSLETVPANWKAGDFVNDDQLDVRDLTLMKRSLLGRGAAIAENGLLLKLHTSYGGYGVAGRDLGSGSFDTEFYVIEGDTFYERSNGHWFRNVRMSSKQLMKIEKIEAETVTVSVISEREGAGGEETLTIGESYAVPSRYVVYDGINYSYEICFERILPGAETESES